MDAFKVSVCSCVSKKKFIKQILCGLISIFFSLQIKSIFGKEQTGRMIIILVISFALEYISIKYFQLFWITQKKVNYFFSNNKEEINVVDSFAHISLFPPQHISFFQSICLPLRKEIFSHIYNNSKLWSLAYLCLTSFKNDHDFSFFFTIHHTVCLAMVS